MLANTDDELDVCPYVSHLVVRAAPHASFGDSRIAGMTPVLPWVFLGGRTEARDIDALRAAAVRLVINVTPPRTEDPVAGVPNFFEGAAPGVGARIAYRRFVL